MHEPEGYVARTGLLSRLGARLAQAVLREPSVILLERDSGEVREPNSSVSVRPLETRN